MLVWYVNQYFRDVLKAPWAAYALPDHCSCRVGSREKVLRTRDPTSDWGYKGSKRACALPTLLSPYLERAAPEEQMDFLQAKGFR